MWILDELVLKGDDYIDNHPGGAFTLEHTVGRDISKFFYGAASLDSDSVNDHRHVHSNIARKVIKNLAIAKLIRNFKIESSSRLMIISHKETIILNKITKS